MTDHLLPTSVRVYQVGGSVRDSLLGKTPQDLDYVVTGATPELMLAAGFSQVGASFPVFLHPVTGDEYALARTERKNGTGYHGFSVSFSPDTSIKDDLVRRDLTINAMALNQNGKLIDPFGGLQDLRNRVLHHVSGAFADDPLRVIRLARFRARLNFTVHPATVKLAKSLVTRGELNTLPDERHLAELIKAFEDPDPCEFFITLRELDVLQHCTFFQPLRGAQASLMAAWTRHFANQHGWSAAQAVDTFAACCPVFARAHQRLLGTDVVRVATALELLWHKLPTGELVEEVLHLVRAWGDGKLYQQFLRAVRVYEVAVGRVVGLTDLLEAAQATGQQVAATQFTETGRELGLAMRATRRQLITNLITAKVTNETTATL
jgi:tRNA nucleotidyltransferase (CCA-adding enzyme)